MAGGNRLHLSKSPYLLQHAGNPVHWQPWDEEALALARREDKPVFLSIGYSTCHWCHVMAHESFEHAETARLLNEHYVAIKVDREERPDLDMTYMAAVQALTGSGGWPMSVFLLPDGRPFAGGTYFTPGRFRKILSSLAGAYRGQRADLEQLAGQVQVAVTESFAAPAGSGEAPGATLVAQVLEALAAGFDAEHGGFRGAPKFPPYNTLALSLYEERLRPEVRRRARVEKTLEAMARGGIRDHVGGGFHRYATDAGWFLPHFEKMLYDNALLSRVYVEAYALTGDAQHRQVAEETYAWVAREMTHPEGGFFCGLDADSEGEEGRFYTWRWEEMLEVLGSEEGGLLARAYQATAEGNVWEERSGQPTGRNHLALLARPQALAAELGVDARDLDMRLAAARGKLLAARNQRVGPHLDDKVLAAWNGLMVESLAYAGRVLGRPEYLAAAQRAADFLHTHLWREGHLLRRWREGEAAVPAFLDDYAYLVNGLLELHAATGEEAHLDWARELLARALRDFRDGGGGFWYTAASAPPLFVRPRELFDNPLPSAVGALLRALLRLSQLSGQQIHRDLAASALTVLRPCIEEHPRGTESLTLAVAMLGER